MRPLLLRAPFFVPGSSRLFSGLVFVISSNVETDMKRRPGDVGLYLRIGISGYLSCRSCAGAAKTKQRKDAGSVRGRRPRTRLRTRPCAGLQPHPACEVRGRLALSKLCSLEDLDRVTGAQLHDGLLPARLRAEEAAAALRLRLHLDDVHALDLDVEQLLDGLAHLRLVRVLMDLEGVLGVRDLPVRLLGDDGADQHLRRMQAHDVALPCTSSRADWETTSERAHTTCATSSSAGTVTNTRSRLRNDFASASSSSPTTTTVGVCCPQFFSRSTAMRVDGTVNSPASTSAIVPACAWSLSALRSAAFIALRLTLTL